MPPYPIYTTYNACIDITLHGFVSHVNCIPVANIGFKTHVNCIKEDYKPSASLVILAASNCVDTCNDCPDCLDCYGQYKDLVNGCYYLNKGVTLHTNPFDLPIDTVYNSVTQTYTTCTTVGVKYKIWNADTNTEQIFDIPLLNGSIADQSWTPTKCGVYKITQEAYNCCMTCENVRYIYVKDYIPEIAFTFNGLCESPCSQENDCEDCDTPVGNCCNCSEIGKPITVTAEIVIPVDLEGVCPCPTERIQNWEQFISAEQYCNDPIHGIAYCSSPYTVTDYVMFPGIVYHYFNVLLDVDTYYVWTMPPAYPTSWLFIPQLVYDDNTFLDDINIVEVQQPGDTVNYLCDDNTGRRIYWKVYKKYPEKTLILQTDISHNLTQSIVFTPEQEGVYIFELNYEACCGTVLQLCKEIVTDISLRPVKTSCYNYTISSCNLPLVYMYRLYKYNAENINLWDLVFTSLVPNSTLTNTNEIHIINDLDGVYKLELYDVTIEGIPVPGDTFIIHEFCSVYNCIAELNRRIICSLPKDCNSCSTPEEVELRNDLNRILMVWETYNMLVYKDTLESKYAISIDNTRLGNIASINQYLQIILKICKKCNCNCKC